jgi:hypothetical protein
MKVHCPVVSSLFCPQLQGGVDLLIVGLLQGLLSYPFFDPVSGQSYAAVAECFSSGRSSVSSVCCRAPAVSGSVLDTALYATYETS